MYTGALENHPELVDRISATRDLYGNSGSVLRRVRESSAEDIVVVTGAHPVEADVRVVHCPDWELGPGASLRCGLAALADDVGAAVVVLADGPDLSPAAIRCCWDAPCGMRSPTKAPAPWSPFWCPATILGLQETSILPMRFPAG